MDIAEAKARLHIPDVWRRLRLPGEPKKLCVCPFHPDSHASFSIYQNGQRWKCFAGCGSGDVVNFLAKAAGLTNREAFFKVLEVDGSGNFGAASSLPVFKPEPVRGSPVFPSDLHQGSPAELRQVANLRGLSLAGVKFASLNGLLLFGRVSGCHCWIVTDAARTLAQGRRMDGLPFPAFGRLDGRKAHTITGSRAAWPIGLREAAENGAIALVEGGPDLLAACHFIAVEGREADVAPVAMLGASHSIPADALPLFARKRVRIFTHLDASGTNATLRWARQVVAAGAAVDAFNLDGLRQMDGSPVGDLNDLARVHGDCYEAERESLDGLLP